MKFLVYTVLFAIIFSLVARLQVYVNYFINQAYYAQVLCVNKNVKKSCCQGKCAMEKELVNLTDKEESPAAKNNKSVLKITKVEQALCHTIYFFLNNTGNSLIKIPYSDKTEKGKFMAVFKPPTAGFIA